MAVIFTVTGIAGAVHHRRRQFGIVMGHRHASRMIAARIWTGQGLILIAIASEMISGRGVIRIVATIRERILIAVRIASLTAARKDVRAAADQSRCVAPEMYRALNVRVCKAGVYFPQTNAQENEKGPHDRGPFLIISLDQSSFFVFRRSIKIFDNAS